MTDSLINKLETAGEGGRGPVQILCDEIGFSFDPRLERPEILIAFVRELVAEVGLRRDVEVHVSRFTGNLPSKASGEALEIAKAMTAAPCLGVSAEARIGFAERLHDLADAVNPDDTTDCDHDVDMLSSCASAIRFGLETPCRSRHAANAADHVWKHRYGIRLFDSHTSPWRKEWSRAILMRAIISVAAEALRALSPKESAAE